MADNSVDIDTLVWDYGVPGSAGSNNSVNLGDKTNVIIAQPDLIQRYFYPISKELGEKIISTRDYLTSMIHEPNYSKTLLIITGPSFLTCPVQAKACSNWLNLISVDNLKTNETSLNSIRNKNLPKLIEDIYDCNKKINRSNLLITMRSNLTKLNFKNSIKSFEIYNGIPICRKLLCDLSIKIPLVGQLSDTLTPQYLADLFCLGLISSSLIESQLHRELVSGSSFPVGFQTLDKNNVNDLTCYNFKITAAKDSILASKNPHHFLSMTKYGQVSIIGTTGNNDTFIILKETDFEEIIEKYFYQDDGRIMIDLGLIDEKNFKLKLSFLKKVLIEDLKVSKRILGIMINSGDHYLKHIEKSSNIDEEYKNISFEDLREGVSNEDLLNKNGTLENELSKLLIKGNFLTKISKFVKGNKEEKYYFENLIYANKMIFELNELNEKRVELLEKF